MQRTHTTRTRPHFQDQMTHPRTTFTYTKMPLSPDKSSHSRFRVGYSETHIQLVPTSPLVSTTFYFRMSKQKALHSKSYILHHTGAPDDWLWKVRSLSSKGQERGRWSSDASVKRHQNIDRTMSENRRHLQHLDTCFEFRATEQIHH